MTSKARAAQSGRAAATRARVVAAASELFVARGYLETTMSGIAAAADVSVQTLYLSFGGKGAILEAALAATATDHPIGWTGPEWEAVRAEPDGPAALARYLTPAAAGVERGYAMHAVLVAASADPEPASLLASAWERTLDAHAAAVDELAERPGFTHHMSLQRATEVLAALVSAQTYGLLVRASGWTTPEWTEWAIRHATADLFPSR